MVKGQRQEMFFSLPDKCMKLQGYLDEGLFTKGATITIMVLVFAIILLILVVKL